MPREGILISNPLKRLSSEQVQQIHEASIEILMDPGMLCFNKKAAEIFQSAQESAGAVIHISVVTELFDEVTSYIRKLHRIA